MSASDIFAYGIATMLNTDGVIIGGTITNTGTVTASGNEGYTTQIGQYIGPEGMD